MRAKELIRYISLNPDYEIVGCGVMMKKPAEYFAIYVDDAHQKIYLDFWEVPEIDFSSNELPPVTGVVNEM